MENKNALRFYQRHGWTIEAQGASPRAILADALAAALNGAEGNLTGITSPCQYIWAATRPASWR